MYRSGTPASSSICDLVDKQRQGRAVSRQEAVRTFLDTSVMIVAFWGDHWDYDASLRIFAEATWHTGGHSSASKPLLAGECARICCPRQCSLISIEKWIKR